MSGGINGKTGELVRWILMLALGGLIWYYTAQNATTERIAVAETSERTHFEEIQRSLTDIKSELRDLRIEVRTR